MRIFFLLAALCAVSCAVSPAAAQCENGVCRVPPKRPIAKLIAPRQVATDAPAVNFIYRPRVVTPSINQPLSVVYNPRTVKKPARRLGPILRIIRWIRQRTP
jgi:hypothetical protein